MHNFTRSLLTEWRRLGLPFDDKTFVVAVSGGADSVSLALALSELRERKKLNLHFVLAHFNHDLRGAESDEDERFVKDLAEKLAFELTAEIQNPKSKIQNQTGNLEQNARLARYEFLAETARKLDAVGVLTAHTLNDQAETFLLNLIRGSGLEGLGGMKPVRSSKFKVQGSKLEEEIIIQSSNSEEKESKIQNPKSKTQLIRPLLRWAKREDTENFCFLNGIEFRRDSMNEDLSFGRVRVRKVLLPLLIDFNPKIVETLGKTAELLREDAELLAQSTNSDARNSGAESESAAFNKENNENTEVVENKIAEYLLLKDLKNVFPSMRRYVVREWLRNKRGDLRRLSAKHFESIENLILSRKSGSRIELPGDEIVFKRGGKLFYKK